MKNSSLKFYNIYLYNIKIDQVYIFIHHSTVNLKLKF